MLGLKYEIGGDIWTETEKYAVGHAVYRLQKDCNITDFDKGASHSQVLNLQQTRQFWNLLKMNSESQNNPDQQHLLSEDSEL